MKKIVNHIKIVALSLMLATVNYSCVKDLDREPYVETTSVTVFSTEMGIKQALAKVYATLAAGGQNNPNVSDYQDIQGEDQSQAQYVRAVWNAQELATDEAIVGWADGNLPEYHTHTWTSGSDKIKPLYARLIYNVNIANEFIRNATDDKASIAPAIKAYRAEARLVRALMYYQALDLFGNPPFVTEQDAPGAFNPKQISRADLFTYIESELKAIEGDLVDARKNTYGRMDKATAWMLLSKLYLNAKVYINADKNTEALTYLNKILTAGYSLEANYAKLFMADNNATSEAIFFIPFDGQTLQTYGGTTYLISGASGGKMTSAQIGLSGLWGGLRTTPQLVDKFKTGDKRAMFFTDGQTKEIDNISTFTDGYAVTKYKNLNSSTGKAGSNPTFADVDFPLFRLADAQLMYAEAVLRGGSGGDRATALNYINAIRKRAGASEIVAGDLTLDFILDERARELMWEGHRRTDLIRFGKFISGYNWAWKGNTKAGKDIEPFRVLYPIPVTDITNNTNLKQNDGYN